jgi:hypothetical protein
MPPLLRLARRPDSRRETRGQAKQNGGGLPLEIKADLY